MSSPRAMAGCSFALGRVGDGSCHSSDATRSATPTTFGRGRCALAALAILTLLLCGCGGQTQPESTSQRGKAVFVAACSSCHTLTGHDSRAPGGDLAIGRFTVPEIESFVRIMPVHISPAEVQAVAIYVHSKMAPSGQSGLAASSLRGPTDTN